MLKKIKTLFLSILVLFGLASCIQIQPSTKYSFKDITNHEVTDIVSVSISYGPMLSSIEEFSGDYEKVFDVEYVLSDISYNETKNIIENYKYQLYIDFTSNDLSYSDIEMYVYEYKLYYFNEDTLYESLEKVNYEDFYTSVPPIEEVHTANVFVMYDYGNYISGKVTTLLDGNLIWFNPKDYGIDTLVAGDELVIEYTGEFICEESYPGRVNADKMHIQSIEVIEADIEEFLVERPSEWELRLNNVDPNRTSIVYMDGGSSVVSQNKDFFYSFDLKTGDVVYGSVKKGSDKFETYYLHDYNPREEIVPTGQFELSIIDKGNDIIDNLSNDSGMYTPGTKLEFYSHPIMDVDLAMYVNDEFYQIQDTIKINDEYIWKYTFVMPAKNVVIEFKTIGIEYTTVRNVLNIPEFSINDIDEVRYEHGYNGVAPGSLSNVTYSTDMEDKNMLLDLLDMPVYEDVTNNWQIDGGGYNSYTIFTTNNEKYDIRISNGYIYINQKHYKFIGQYVSFEYPSIEAHSFITYSDTFEAYTLDNIKIGDFDGLSEYEFIEYPYDDIPENEDAGYIETEFGRLYIHSDNIFYIKENNVHTYYLIVGDKNFSNIFIK